MKTKLLLAAVLIVITASCGNRKRNFDDSHEGYYDEEFYEEDEGGEYDEEGNYEEAYYEEGERGAPRESRYQQRQGKKSSGWGRVFGSRTKTHQFRDAKTGLVVKDYEYPASWKVISRPTYDLSPQLPNFLIQIEGPNGLKAFNTPLKYYVFYSDPNLFGYLPQNVQRMHRREVSVQQLAREEVEQRMKNSGFRFVGTRPTDKYESYVRRKLQEGGHGNQRLEMYSTVWTNDQGLTGIATVSKLALDMPLVENTYYTLWLYGVDYTFAENEHVDELQEKIVQTVIDSREHPEWQQYVQAVQKEQQRQNQERSRQSAIAHQNRMNARWASFNAHQERMKGLSNAMDANHASFMNRNFGAGSGSGQREFVNMIHGEETVYNPLNGQSYQVDHGAKQHWMDSNGNLIENNDLFYTPNGDINLNNREWVKVGGAY